MKDVDDEESDDTDIENENPKAPSEMNEPPIGDGGAILQDLNTTQYQDPNGPGITDMGSGLTAGGYGCGSGMTAGALINDADMNHKQMFHHLLVTPKHQWEAVREAASQMLGGAPSAMWENETGNAVEIGGGMYGGAQYIAGGFNHEDVRDILMCPTAAAAARLVELEHESKGAGFKNALNKAIKLGKNIYHGAKKGYNDVSKGLNVASRIADTAAKHYDIAKPAAQTLHNIQSNKKEIEDVAKEHAKNIKDIVNAAKAPKNDAIQKPTDHAESKDGGGVTVVAPANPAQPEEKKKKRGGGGKGSRGGKTKKPTKEEKKLQHMGGMRNDVPIEPQMPAGSMAMAGGYNMPKWIDPRRRY